MKTINEKKLDWFMYYKDDLHGQIEKEKKEMIDEYKQQGYEDSAIETIVACKEITGYIFESYIITVRVQEKLTDTSKTKTVVMYQAKQSSPGEKYFFCTDERNTREENLRIIQANDEWDEIKKEEKIEKDLQELEELRQETKRLREENYTLKKKNGN